MEWRFRRGRCAGARVHWPQHSSVLVLQETRYIVEMWSVEGTMVEAVNTSSESRYNTNSTRDNAKRLRYFQEK